MAPCGHLEARPPHLVFSFLLVLSSLFYEFPVAPGTSSRLSLIISACLRTRAGVEHERFSVLLIICARGVLARLDSAAPCPSCGHLVLVAGHVPGRWEGLLAVFLQQNCVPAWRTRR